MANPIEFAPKHIREQVEQIHAENPGALKEIGKAIQTTQEKSDEQYVANALDVLNHRRMKKVANDMLAGRAEKPMTAVELADMLSEWADKNRSDRDV